MGVPSFKFNKDSGGPRGRPNPRGMTLAEVMMALLVLALLLGGIANTLLQSRRLTEGSLAQNSVTTIVQGYMEQLKSCPLPSLIGALPAGQLAGITTTIPTQIDQDTADPLVTSTGYPPALNTLTPGVTPSGVTDNLKDFSASGFPQGSVKDWNVVWPYARNFPTPNGAIPTSTAYSNDLHLNIWVWVSDVTTTAPSTSPAKPMYAITLIYTWQVNNGIRVSYFMGTVRAVRSTVPRWLYH